MMRGLCLTSMVKSAPEAAHLFYCLCLSPSRQPRCHHFSALLLLLLVILFFRCSHADAASNVETIDLSQLEATRVSAKLVGTMDNRYVNESSALATSAIHDGVLWTLNDSGNRPAIFPVTLDGSLLGSSTSVGISIEGAENFDWEAMTSDRKGTLYIADSGHNFNFARTTVIYKINEPVDLNPASSVPLLEKIPYSYEDQSGFFMSRNEFDVEAMFYSDHTLNLLTKGWGDSISKWYRLQESQESEEFGNVARLVAHINFGKALITGAEVDQSGLHLVVLAKRSIWLFTRNALGQNWFTGKITYLRTRDIGVTEGVSFYGKQLYISNEAGQLYKVSLESFYPE